MARLLVSRLIPAAVPGKQDMNTVVQSTVAYDKLDRAEYQHAHSLEQPGGAEFRTKAPLRMPER